MEKMSIEIGSHVVAYRLLAKPDGQPDIIESFSTLNQILGDQNWTPIEKNPGFSVSKIGDQSIYTMTIVITNSGLDALKLYDVINHNVRVVEDRRATWKDLERLSADRPKPAGKSA